MQPTTRGRYRIHDRRDDGGFVLVELPAEPVAPDDPDAADAYDPLFVEGTEPPVGDTDVLTEPIADLEPGDVVDAELVWNDGTARFVELEVVRESRFYFADNVEGMFEAAVDAWEDTRAAGEAVTSQVTRSTDGEPNGALYLFADAPGRDLFAEIRAGRVPIEPLIARVNTRREPDERAVFVLRPANYRFVAVYVVFDANGILARTVQDTYGIGEGLGGGADRSATRGSTATSEASLEDLDLEGDGTRNL